MSPSSPEETDRGWIAASRLWLVTDRSAAAPRSMAEAARLAIDGGVDVVLFRLQDEADPTVVWQQAQEVLKVCRSAAVPFVVSHRIELAIEIRADGLQLGAADMPLAQFRELHGPGMPLGYSSHGIVEARQAFADGADYVFIGPIYVTPSKLQFGAPLGPQIVLEAQQLPGPVVMIGGIAREQALELGAHGARRIAAIRSLQAVSDPRAAAAELRSALLAAESAD